MCGHRPDARKHMKLFSMVALIFAGPELTYPIARTGQCNDLLTPIRFGAGDVGVLGEQRCGTSNNTMSYPHYSSK
jgi:hypothetical protein